MFYLDRHKNNNKYIYIPSRLNVFSAIGARLTIIECQLQQTHRSERWNNENAYSTYLAVGYCWFCRIFFASCQRDEPNWAECCCCCRSEWWCFLSQRICQNVRLSVQERLSLTASSPKREGNHHCLRDAAQPAHVVRPQAHKPHCFGYSYACHAKFRGGGDNTHKDIRIFIYIYTSRTTRNSCSKHGKLAPILTRTNEQFHSTKHTTY